MSLAPLAPPAATATSTVMVVAGLSAPLADLRRAVREGRISEALDALGALAEADDQADLAGIGEPAHDDRLDRAVRAALTVECLLARGEVQQALEVSPLIETLRAVDDLAGAVARYAAAELADAFGETEDAVAAYLSAGRADGADRLLVPWRAGAALALVRLGRRREALDLAREHLELVAAAEPLDVARALRTLATVDPDGGGLPRLRDALAVLDGVPAERMQAQITADLAALLLLRGAPHEVAEAVPMLRQAETYAAREGLTPLEQRVRRLLGRAGEVPRRRHSEILALLTAAERRVALLALAGHTNREIALQLTVSVKAVEGHLSKVYRKLGVSSRGSLLASLRQPA